MKKPNKQEQVDAKSKFLKEYPKKNYSIGETCRACNISRQTYYNWMNEDEKFKEVIETFREDFIDIAEQALLELNKERNPQTVIFTLKTLGKRRGYQEQQKVDITTNGESINKIVIEIINPEEKEEEKTEGTIGFVIDKKKKEDGTEDQSK